MADFPTIVLVAGPDAASPGPAADRCDALWRHLCQSAEAWRLNLWTGGSWSARSRFAQVGQADDALRALIAESGAKAVLPVAGATIDAAALPRGVRLIGEADLPPPPADHAATGALVARNLGLSVVIARATFNPHLRLLHCQYEVRGSVPPGSLSGAIRRTDGSDAGLVNAWVQNVNPPAGKDGWLRATAVLGDNVDPADVVIDLHLWGWPIARFTGNEAIETEVAGLAGLRLSPDGGSAEATYWSVEQGTDIQFGRKRMGPAPLVTDARGMAAYRAATPYPLDRETLTVLPPEGQGVGQRFTQFRLFDTPLRPTSARLGAMRDSLAGRTAWLIGNGPSVRTQDLDALADAGALCFAFNRFHLAHDVTRLRPQFTVTGDSQMIEDFGQTIVDQSGGTVFVADAAAPALVGDYVWIRQMSVFPSLFSFDADLLVTPGGSSVYVAMQIAWFLGIRRFYLYGSDFTFRFTPPAQGTDAFRSATGEGNHFIANYRAGAAWCPPAIENILSSFMGARAIMAAEGGFIRNATHGGEMHVFDRIDFEEALENSR